MAVCFLDLKRQYLELKPELDAAIAEVIASSAFIGGPRVAAFEAAFANYIGCAHCVGCGNGTDAIEIALEALKLPIGSEVIVPANTFIATSEAVTRAGLKVVFCDVDRDDYTMTAETVRPKLSDKTSALLPVHLYGQPCRMDALVALAKQNGLAIVEDCAQAHGAEFCGKRVGTFGALGTFSFYPGKNLGAYGDAGAVVTNDAKLALRVRMIANHGRTKKYDHEFEGRSSRLDGIQAAILSVKLSRLDEWIDRRQTVARVYLDGLSGVGDLELPKSSVFARHVYHLFVVRTKRRDSLQDFLKARGIETGIHYPIALPKLEAYAHLGQAKEHFFANSSDAELLSLPIGDHMSSADAEEVVAGCRAFFAD